MICTIGGVVVVVVIVLTKISLALPEVGSDALVMETFFVSYCVVIGALAAV